MNIKTNFSIGDKVYVIGVNTIEQFAPELITIQAINIILTSENGQVEMNVYYSQLPIGTLQDEDDDDDCWFGAEAIFLKPEKCQEICDALNGPVDSLT